MMTVNLTVGILVQAIAEGVVLQFYMKEIAKLNICKAKMKGSGEKTTNSWHIHDCWSVYI